MTRIDLNETSLEYVECGNGPPVVLVHGSASDHRTWEHQLKAFAPQFRVLSYSRRYHWPNAPIPEGGEYAMSEQLEDLEKLVRWLDAPNVHLVGHSYGAYLALLLTIRDPKLVGSLVLAEPPVIPLFTSFPPKPQEILKLLFRRPTTALPIIKFAATGLGPATVAAKRDDMETALKYFGRAVLGSRAFAELSPARFEQARQNSFKAEFLSDSFMTPLRPADVSRLEVPTLLVTGDQSPRMFHRLTDRLQELLPHAERIAIPGASHIMYEDNPSAFNHAILSFLQRQDKTQEQTNQSAQNI